MPQPTEEARERIIHRRPGRSRRGLSKGFTPEFDALVAAARDLGLVVPEWEPPEFRIRRNRRGGTRAWGHGSPVEAVVYVGQWCRRSEAVQVIAHELAHAIMWRADDDDHGPCFRGSLRLLVEQRWPKARWKRVAAEGAEAAYEEDTLMAAAIARAYPEYRHLVL